MKSNSKKKRLFLLEPMFKALAHCSLACLFRLAKVFGFFIARTKNQVSKNTKKNLSLCFSHLSKSQRQMFYRESIQHTACSLIEMAALWHHPVDKVLSLTGKVNTCDSYQTDNGAKIIIVPHYGSWEFMIYWLAQHGDFYTLYKPAKGKQLDDYILRKRTRNGAQLVPTNLIGLRALLKGLKAGATVMILPDQKPGKDNAKIDADFYGHKASTSLLINSLMKKVTCSVYIGSALRNLQQANYQIEINELEGSQFLDDDQQSADYLNQSIESFIKQDETQYQWSYRRYRKEIYAQITKGNK